MLRRIGKLLPALVASASLHAAINPADLALVPWPDASTTFSEPVGVRAPAGDNRVFVVERCDTPGSSNTSGHVRIVKNGVALPTPFLEVNVSCSSEQGLLGLAFDPQFASNGTFYVTYTAVGAGLADSEDQVLARYTVSANPDVANPSGTVILRVPDIAGNHNGGDLHFDHQGYLNWSMGDGGVQNDPNGFAQCTGRKKADNNPSSCHSVSGSGPTYYLLGKIIRLDVHATTASAPANFCGASAGQPAPYAIPPGNPFRDVGLYPQECAEIFNWGFRNPYRFSFDRQTGDLLIGDVGQNAWEEVSFQAAGSVGQNFQWNACEGLHTFPGGSLGCNGPAGSVKPKLDYSHSIGCAVSGGYVYRGPIAPLRGQYVFSDYCSGDIYVVANTATTQWTYETLAGTPSMNTYGFGEDADGNLYATTGGGTIYRFESASGGDLIFANGFDG
ncbi:PQQ-dependent sugar dehydrogenase [Dokdonella sp.]|uniref:PQQ-dependent sugar dehydrogenase n=1 Tax=Dokdonella sp. TaxID=2291710 RepID=UPI0037837487